jgi:predicted PurR-regulated permease PerM
MSSRSQEDEVFVSRAVEAAIRIGLLVALLAFCLAVLRPFVVVVLWGAILATALYPAYEKGVELLGGRSKLTAVLFALAGIILLVLPTVALSNTALEGVRFVAKDLKEGNLKIPAAPEQVASWPLIGARVSAFWNLASQNLQAAAVELKPQLIGLGSWLLSSATSAAFALLQFVFSIVVAGVMLAHAQGGGRVTRALATRLAGERGAEYADLAGATVRSVAQGVIGVALIQSTLAGIALVIVGVPAAGLWALLVLVLAIVQLPPLLILGPIIVYVFYTASTVTAIVFGIWCAAVSFSDSLLKPLLLGRGLEVPMLVILLGAIGGVVSAGIIGLFIGSVGLALGHQLFTAWISEEVERAAPV